MQRSMTRDLVVGLFVLIGLVAIAYLSFTVGGFSLRRNEGLILYAAFDEIGGLKPRAPVEIAGVRVGQVEKIILNGNFRARVEMNLERALQLPVDTSASIMTAGLLGDRFVSLQLGGEDAVLKAGDEIRFTESAVVLERLIGKLVHDTDVEKKQ